MIERLTITLPADMATALKAAVASGDYATTSEIVREALRDWKHKKALQTQAFEELRRDIGIGVADMEGGGSSILTSTRSFGPRSDESPIAKRQKNEVDAVTSCGTRP